MIDRPKTAHQFVAAIDRWEMAALIAEGYHGVHRPRGATAEEAMMGIDKDDRDGFLRAADRVADYIVKQINSGGSA